MSKRKVTYYEPEFKSMIQELYLSGKSVKELSSEYGLPQSTVRQWVVYNLKGAEVKTASDLKLLEELAKIKKELSSLKEENSILKKAFTIFAQK